LAKKAVSALKLANLGSNVGEDLWFVGVFVASFVIALFQDCQTVFSRYSVGYPVKSLLSLVGPHTHGECTCHRLRRKTKQRKPNTLQRLVSSKLDRVFLLLTICHIAQPLY